MGSRRIRTVVLAGALAMLALASGCAPPFSALTQIRAVAACITDDGYGGLCRDGRFLDGSVAASTPDGKFIYVAGIGGNSLSIIRRGANGELAQKTTPAGCWLDDAAPSDECKKARALDRLTAVVATKTLVVVADIESDAVTVFNRNPETGALTQPPGKAACISETGRSDPTDPATDGDCAIGRNLDGPTSLAVSGNTIIAGTDGGLALIKRNPDTGKLSQPAGAKGCVTNDGSGGECANGRGIVDTARAVAARLPAIYLAVGDAILVFVRQPDATLKQEAGVNGCISDDGTDADGGVCTDGRALRAPLGLATLGGTIFSASTASEAVARFTRDPSSGTLTQGAGSVGCISETGESFPGEGVFTQCTDGHHLHAPRSLALRGSTIFVGSSFRDDTTTAPGAVAAVTQDPNTGALSQGAGAVGCINDGEQDDGCLEGYAIDNVTAVTVAKNGPVFATSFGIEDLGGRRHEGGLSALQYNGVFSQGVDGNAGCVSETGQSSVDDPLTAGECINGVGLDGAVNVAVSPDGKHVYVVSTGTDAVAAFRRNASTGALRQLAASAACISETGAGQCANGRALGEPLSVVVSNDGKHVYVVSTESGGVAAFKRKAATGALTQLPGASGCITDTGASGCTDGRALHDAKDLVISPDGAQVYVTSSIGDAVAVLSRNSTTGALTQTSVADGCVSETGAPTCTDVKALDGPFSIDTTQNGESLYVASLTSQSITVLSRNTSTGVLSQPADPAGCVSETGRSVPGDAGTAGQCGNGEFLTSPISVEVAGNESVYAHGTGDSISSFSRNASTGALTPIGCHSEDGSGGSCIDATAVSAEVGRMATTSDGQSLYFAADARDAVSAFGRDFFTGELTQVGSPFACVSDSPIADCTVGKALAIAIGVAVSPDNRHVYVTAFDDDSVAIFARSIPEGFS